ncbi:hypothetical protein LMH87_006034 [Akanthomyces muscarius]|uniref:Zn(2)-C6 fungal-type domain-containing protein n=1 Tax=Akanthomyces muscarius TaxID=2231603 RepID=A0A9W8QQC8_AKAMU|nr:hypothetical protein LMH87_006034 [Akanthomyces muscarius]KAJ4164357.1 hypothetical protein LMH87_006034 [Akanthomyces muscarius]
MEMPVQPAGAGLGPLPAGRTGHACAQCRHRKQKCGGFTHDIKCRPCTTRRVKCSFQDERRRARKGLRLGTSLSLRPLLP